MCVLRASGAHFNPDSFLRDSTLRPSNVFLKGNRKAEAGVWETSGITVPVSEASLDDFGKQVEEAIEFLRSNREELFRLKTFAGVEDVRLDFAVSRREVFDQYQFLHAELVALAGALGMGLEISIYGPDG